LLGGLCTHVALLQRLERIHQHRADARALGRIDRFGIEIEIEPVHMLVENLGGPSDQRCGNRLIDRPEWELKFEGRVGDRLQFRLRGGGLNNNLPGRQHQSPSAALASARSRVIRQDASPCWTSNRDNIRPTSESHR
jgi:hypothetical protein